MLTTKFGITASVMMLLTLVKPFQIVIKPLSALKVGRFLIGDKSTDFMTTKVLIVRVMIVVHQQKGLFTTI